MIQMPLSDYIKQTKRMQKFKKWAEIKWKQYWCQHEFKVDKMSLQLPMSPVYRCTKCDKWK